MIHLSLVTTAEFLRQCKTYGIALFVVLCIACQSDDDNATPEAVEQPTPVETPVPDETPSTPTGIPQEIKDLIVYAGEEDAPIVIVNAQAGSDIELHSDDAEVIIELLGSTGYLAVNVHQAQTLNPESISTTDITLEQAIAMDAQSVEMLYKVIKYFKDDGRTVYVFGSSFGGLVTQGLIAQKGIDVADKYLIVASRLDIEEVMWKALSEGKVGLYENGTTPVIPENPEETVVDRNTARIIGGFVMPRYTELFSAFDDLSKITYVYGTNDEAVGGLTTPEVEFLESKNTTIIQGTGNHDETTGGDMIVDIFTALFGNSN